MYSPKDVWINYTINGSSHKNGVQWTELWYQGPGSSNWTLYAPPWNPKGRWVSPSGTDHHSSNNGTIIFDTTFTGGDGLYNFTSVAVSVHHVREPGPPRQESEVKAQTTVDSMPPLLFIAKPTPNSWTNSEWLAWNAHDEGSGVAEVEVSVDDEPWQNFTEAGGQMNMSLTTQGVHNITVRASDWAGNSVTVPFAFHYDTEAPGLSITSPAPNAYVNTTSLEVVWTASDPATIATLEMAVDSNGPMALANTTTSYGLEGLAEGGHVVSLLVVDAAGNVAFQTVSFTVDTTPPEVQIVVPADGSYADSSQLQVLWAGADGGSGIDHYQVSLDGGAAFAVGTAMGYAFANAAEGSHTVTVTAYDRAGNRNLATSAVFVDTTLPVVGIQDPRNGTTVYGSVSVNWTASDSGSGIAKVVVVVDNINRGVAVSQATLALGSLSVGVHAVTVEVWDHAGNLNQTTVAFSYGGASPPNEVPASGPATDFWIIMAIIGAIAVASAYLAVRRRKTPKT